MGPRPGAWNPTHGDIALAEEVTQEAFEAALDRFRRDGVPEHPRAWLVQTARNIAVDRVRRRRVLVGKLETYAADLEPDVDAPTLEIPDDRLRLVFTCCHPALALEAQVALTLRTLLGLETDEIARAFLVPQPRWRNVWCGRSGRSPTRRSPYVVPEASEMPDRLHAVLTVIYLVFTEGYAATRGASLVRTDLSAEAIRLARLVRGLTGGTPPAEVTGLVALLLLHDARRDARLDDAGDVVVLDEQDRSRWNRAHIEEALPLAIEALQGGGRTVHDPGGDRRGARAREDEGRDRLEGNRPPLRSARAAATVGDRGAQSSIRTAPRWRA